MKRILALTLFVAASLAADASAQEMRQPRPVQKPQVMPVPQQQPPIFQPMPQQQMPAPFPQQPMPLIQAPPVQQAPMQWPPVQVGATCVTSDGSLVGSLPQWAPLGSACTIFAFGTAYPGYVTQ